MHAIPKLTAVDEARIARWHAAGRPPVPVVVDVDGRVITACTNVRALLAYAGTPARLRDAAIRWIDDHCRPRG